MTAAVSAVARAGLRRRWTALVALGLIGGLAGAVVAGTVAVARRTGTAHHRLLARSGIGDVIVTTITEDPTVPRRILALPGVRSGWIAGYSVARPDFPSVTYVSMVSGPTPPAGMYDLPVVEGRAADPANPLEVVVMEAVAKEHGLRPGTRIPVKFLTPAEIGQFDVGFGEPDGPAVELTVTGLVRSPVAGNGIAPIIATPAFHERFGAATVGPTVTSVRLLRGAAGVADFEHELDAIRTTATVPPGFEEMTPVQTVDPAQATAAVNHTASVLVDGLAAFAMFAAAAGLVVLVAGFSRHHDDDNAEQAIERALGLTLGQRVTARVLPAVLAGGVAAVATVVGVLVAGGMAPMGALRGSEPSPGWSPNLAIAAAAAAVAFLAVVAVAAVTAATAGRSSTRAHPARVSRVADRLAAAGAPPPSVVGVRLALQPGRGREIGAVRSAVVGGAIAVAGITSVAIFATSLHRLVSSPSRWGGAADFSISDVDPPTTAALLADQRLDQVSLATSYNAVVDGQAATAVAFDQRRGSLGWTIVDGRAPAAANDVVLGTRLARRLTRHTGDTVTIDTTTGKRTFEVVGLGIGPSPAGQAIGSDALISPDGARQLGLVATFVEAYVRAAPGRDAAAVTAAYAADHEVNPRTRPPDIDNLRQLGSLPAGLALFLGVLGIAALANGIVVVVRRRRRVLAIVRTLGFTSWQAAAAVLVMAGTTALVAVVIGIPVGVIVGRGAWTAVAHGTAVATDPVGPAWLAAIVPLTLLVAMAVALRPARRAGRQTPARLLQPE